MIITDEKLKGSIEDKMAIADSFNLMDDDFFAVVMRDKAACSYTLSRLLDKKLNVIKVDTQYAIRNYNGHSVVLDALAEDDEHKLYNIEVQVKNKDYHPKRVRYYQASLDTLFLEKNQNYKELPELYLIFISATDWLKGGKCKYTVCRMVDETHQEIDNGVHEYYFNAAVDDGSSLAKLLQYLKNSSADNSSFGELSKAVYNHNGMKAKNYCPEFEEYKTIRQWALLGQLPKKDAKGVELWANKNCQASYMYYSPDEVDPATEKELQDFFQPERDRKNKLARLNRKWHKEAEEKKRQEEQKKIFDEAVEAALLPYRDLIWKLTEKTKELYPKKEYPKSIVIDTETTGLDPFRDELLQVSIIDEEGNVLFDSYFKPLRHKEWSKAESVNHISPKMVADAPYINEKAAELYAILSQAHWIIGYNVDFDLRFLMGSDIITDEEYNAFRTEDVMIQFAEIYGEYSVYHEDYKWQKLTTAAAYYDYDWNVKGIEAHNSLADCFATLFVYHKILSGE